MYDYLKSKLNNLVNGDQDKYKEYAEIIVKYFEGKISFYQLPKGVGDIIMKWEEVHS